MYCCGKMIALVWFSFIPPTGTIKIIVSEGIVECVVPSQKWKEQQNLLNFDLAAGLSYPDTQVSLRIRRIGIFTYFKILFFPDKPQFFAQMQSAWAFWFFCFAIAWKLSHCYVNKGGHTATRICHSKCVQRHTSAKNWRNRPAILHFEKFASRNLKC